MYQALYRACRPEVFDEILGQEHIVKILKHQIATDSVNHAYLFCGTRGTGKTTTARILAKAVNCLDADVKGRPCGKCEHCKAIQAGTFMDVIEIDAASNNGVDNIRELRESVKYPPVAGRKKVYIIDEVHMLSTGAFNALLKTLEEPPENVIFILATTEPNKLPQTILSRCMRLDFKRVPENLLISGMNKICTDKGVEISDGALKLLANAADGSVRDGLSILDQVLAAGDKKIERDDVLEYIGAVGEEFFIELTELVSLKKVSEAFVLLDSALSEGKDVKQLMRDWTSHYRNLLITKFIKNPEDMLNMSTENIAKVREQSQHISLDEINDAIIKLSKTINDARWSTQPRILLELAIVEIAEGGKIEMQPKRVEQPATRAVEVKPAKASMPVEAVEKKAEQAEPKAQQAPKAVSADFDADLDLEKIWREVFEEGEDGAGSFNLIRTGTRLERIDAMTFLVRVNSNFTKNYAESKKKEIEKIMTNKMGRPMRMICEIALQEVEEPISLEDATKKASETLGIDITIE